MQRLQRLFHPRNVAVIGASADQAKIGGMVLSNIRASGYQGGIFAVSRSGAIDGVGCVATITELPREIDLAFLAIPAEATPDAIKACAVAGIGEVIVGSSGFAESGEAGKARQAEITAAARAVGMQIVGPNCNGIYNAHAPLSIGFNTGHALAIPPGDVAILSHSGAMFDIFARRLMANGAGMTVFVSAGNEADLDILDYLEHCIGDSVTKVIALVLDAVPDGNRLRHLAEAARKNGKQIVALKVGLSDRGELAAIAHSSRLMSNGRAYRALLEGCGIALLDTVEGLMAAAAMLSRYGRRGESDGLSVLSTSGAGGALMADLALTKSVAMPDFCDATQAVLDRYTRFSQAGNPLDVGVFGNFSAITEIAHAVAADPGVGVVAALLPTLAPGSRLELATAYAAAAQASGKPHLVIAPGGLDEMALEDYAKAGIMVFTDTHCALDAISAYLQPVPKPVTSSAPELVPNVTGSGAVGETESLALLAAMGIAVVEATPCTNADDAVRAATAIGYPVVLKGVVEGVAHKSDLGLVHLDLGDEAAIRAAYTALGGDVLVQPMLAGKLEIIAGITRNKDTGPMLLAGLGGIYAEAIDDVAIWSLPTERGEFERKLRDSTLGRILTSPRWQEPDVLPALVESLLALQELALTLCDRLQAVDVNPLLVCDRGVFAVDALVVLSGED